MSAAGAGALCRQTIARGDVETGALSPSFSRAEEDGLEKPTRPLILVVEDDAISASIVSEVLKGWADTEIVSRGAQTHERARSLRPDLILLDVLMPETDGYEVCGRLKRDPDTRDIPVIFVSSLADEAEEARGLLAGAVDYVIKPISAPVLTARVRNHLELVRRRRRLERESPHDALTGLATPVHLDEMLEREWRRSGPTY